MKKRKSIHLHLLEGNPNRLTKQEIKERLEHEKKMRGRTDNIEAPAWLNKRQREEFYYYADQLLELEIFSNLDTNTLAQYIKIHANFVRVSRATDRVTNKEMDEDFEEYARRTRMLNQLSDQCRKLANDLGLTVDSRLKLVVPKKEEEEKSEVDRKFGNV